MSSRLDFLRKLGGIAVATSIPTSILNAQPSEDKVIKDFAGYKFIHDSTKPVLSCNFGNRALAAAITKVFDAQTDRQIKATKLEDNGRIDEAIKLYEKNISEECWDSYSYDRLRVIYRKQHRFEDMFRIIFSYLTVHNQLKESKVFEMYCKDNDIELLRLQSMGNNLYDHFVYWHYKTKEFIKKHHKKLFPNIDKEKYFLYKGTKEEQNYAWILLYIRDIEKIIKNND